MIPPHNLELVPSTMEFIYKPTGERFPVERLEAFQEMREAEAMKIYQESAYGVCTFQAAL